MIAITAKITLVGEGRDISDTAHWRDIIRTQLSAGRSAWALDGRHRIAAIPVPARDPSLPQEATMIALNYSHRLLGSKLGAGVTPTRLGHLGLIILPFLVACAGAHLKDGKAEADTGHKYSMMSPDDARRRIDVLVKDGKLPLPAYLGRLELPTGNLAAWGVRRGDADYVVFASARPAGNTMVPIGNLLQLLPALRDIWPKASEGDHAHFTVNGILYSTVDLTVRKRIAFVHSDAGRWSSGNTIQRGGYLWNVGPAGILLKKDSWIDARLLPFAVPIKDYPRDSFRTYEVTVIVAPGGRSIRLQVAGDAVEME